MMTTTEREAMLALAKRADDCLNSRSSAYPSDVLRECIAALRLASSPPAAGSEALTIARKALEDIADGHGKHYTGKFSRDNAWAALDRIDAALAQPETAKGHRSNMSLLQDPDRDELAARFDVAAMKIVEGGKP